MKLIVSNGRDLTVRDVGPILMRLAAPSGGMVRRHGASVLDEDAARVVLRDLMSEGCVRVSE